MGVCLAQFSVALEENLILGFGHLGSRDVANIGVGCIETHVILRFSRPMQGLRARSPEPKL